MSVVFKDSASHRASHREHRNFPPTTFESSTLTDGEVAKDSWLSHKGRGRGVIDCQATTVMAVVSTVMEESQP